MMKPPRLPGTEKFRFCDKKYEQQARPGPELKHHDEQIENERILSDKSLIVTDSILFGLTHSLSDHYLPCSYPIDLSETKSKILETESASSTIDELICQLNIPITRYNERNKRKPHLPISSRLTSRVYTLTTYIDHRSENDPHSSNYCLDKLHRLYCQCKHPQSSSLIIDDQNCSSGASRSITPISFDSESNAQVSTSPNLLVAKCCLGPTNYSSLHVPDQTNIKFMVNSTSHTSLMSDESSTSISSMAIRPSFDDSLRSSSCSPIDHWAKHVANQNRLSTSSQLSWQDDSVLR